MHQGGFRVGWLDELATGTPDTKENTESKSKKKPPESDPVKKAKADEEKAKGVFDEAEKGKDKKDEIPPLPPEADADTRARVDQVLNRKVNVAVAQAPRRDVLGLIMSQVRLGYDLDDKTLAKADVDLSQTMEIKADGLSARDALAEVLGGVGSLSYRVTDQGRLFITTAARLAEEAGSQRKVIEGPPVKLVMSQPLKPTDPSYREMTREALVRRLVAQGLRDDLAQFLLDEYGSLLFEPGELIVLAHFSRDALDGRRAARTSSRPPRKLLVVVRVAVLLVRWPDLNGCKTSARVRAAALAILPPKTRETAESRLSRAQDRSRRSLRAGRCG